MEKFKVGDRVKVIKRGEGYYGSGHECDLGTITEITSVDKFGEEVEYTTETGWFFYDHEIEPVAVAGSNSNEGERKFKVGDRVRAVQSSGGSAVTKDTIYTVTEVNGERIHFVNNNGRADNWGAKYFEPCALRIREGLYYKTRDGRKVGPAEVSDDYEYPWRVCGALHLDNGRWLNDDIEDDNDLIAEWTDEPVTAATSAPKFKVGDRVATDGDFTFDPAVGTITEVDNDLYVVSVDEHGGGWNYFADELRLVAPATSGKVDVSMLSSVSANLGSYSTTGFTVPLDAPEFGGAESKFKVGDRVHYSDYICEGVGIITESNGDDDWYVAVEEKDREWAPFDNDTTRVFDSADLRLVAKATSGKDDEPDAIARIQMCDVIEAKEMARAGIFTINEVRKKFGLPPIVNGEALAA